MGYNAIADVPSLYRIEVIDVPGIWMPDDPDDIARRYLAGESEKALAEALGVSRTPVRRFLLDRGLATRGRSDAMRARMASLSASERIDLTAAAHATVRGRKASEAELAKRALTREGRLSKNVSTAERSLMSMLRSRGISGITFQKAIGKYNADLATGSVAVEILGGSWHRSKKHGERLRYLLNAGWDVIFVWVDGIHYPLRPEAAEYIVAHLQFRQANPSARRCYRVIRGTGEYLAGAEFDGGQLPDVLPNSDRPEVPPEHVAKGLCQCGCGKPTAIAKKSNTALGWVAGQPRRYLSGHNTRRPH